MDNQQRVFLEQTCQNIKPCFAVSAEHLKAMAILAFHIAATTAQKKKPTELLLILRATRQKTTAVYWLLKSTGRMSGNLMRV
jgi:hypothetical protein